MGTWRLGGVSVALVAGVFAILAPTAARAPHAPELRAKLVFPHSKHVPREWITSAEVPRDCRGCHDYAGGRLPEASCKVCHEKSDKDGGPTLRVEGSLKSLAPAPSPFDHKQHLK